MNLLYVGNRMNLVVVLVVVCIAQTRLARCSTRRADYQACWKVSISSDRLYLLSQPSVDNCQTKCNEYLANLTESVRVAAIQEHNCFCGTAQENALNITEMSPQHCPGRCATNSNDFCGSNSTYSVYGLVNRSCDDPGTPENGFRSSNDSSIGSEITFSCERDLRLKGSSVIRCSWQENNTFIVAWNDTAPTCVDNLPTTPEGSTITSSATIPPKAENFLAPIAGSVAGAVAIVIFLMIVVLVIRHKRQKNRKADFTNVRPKPDIPKKESSQVKLSLTVSDEQDEDYLVPDVKTYVDSRPRLPAPSSRKEPTPGLFTSVSPNELVYQNRETIAMTRSRENLNKEVSAGKKPTQQIREIDLHQGDTKSEGDTDQIYENSAVSAITVSSRLLKRPQQSKPPDSASTKCTQIPKKESLNLRDSVDYITPNEPLNEEQEMYENAGVFRPNNGKLVPSPRARHPQGHQRNERGGVNTADAGDSDGVYLEIIADQ